MRPSCIRAALLLVLVALALPARAQQNLFNVPNAELTKERTLFFQSQGTLQEDGGLRTNTTFDYGLRDWLEVGVNLLNAEATAPGEAPPFGEQGRTQLLGNMSVGGELSDGFALQAGVQLGGALRPAPGTSPLLVNGWATVRSELAGIQLVTGGYVGTLASRGPGSPAGLMLAAQVPVIQDKLELIADATFGTNSRAVTVFGGSWHVTQNWQLAAGWQLPSPGTVNEHGGVLQLTRKKE